MKERSKKLFEAAGLHVAPDALTVCTYLRDFGRKLRDDYLRPATTALHGEPAQPQTSVWLTRHGIGSQYETEIDPRITAMPDDVFV